MTIEVETSSDPLAVVRRVLDGADEALLGIAFVQQRGVNLIERQMNSIGTGRLISTTVFGSTTSQGLNAASAGGLGVRVLNLSRGTFHPKLYLARHGDTVAAAVGSANLTSGLVANVETVALLRGPHTAPQLRQLWELGESWWHHTEALDWSPDRIAAPSETLEPDLIHRIEAALAANPQVLTLTDGKVNWVKHTTPDGLWVETERSRALGRPPQLVEAWMIQVAWEWLKAHGTLTNRFLLSTDGLNVKRSSFVCALLALVRGVEVVSRRPITLRLDPRAVSASQPQR